MLSGAAVIIIFVVFIIAVVVIFISDCSVGHAYYCPSSCCGCCGCSLQLRHLICFFVFIVVFIGHCYCNSCDDWSCCVFNHGYGYAGCDSFYFD